MGRGFTDLTAFEIVSPMVLVLLLVFCVFVGGMVGLLLRSHFKGY